MRAKKVNENKGLQPLKRFKVRDYSQASYKMDKFLIDEQESQEEYWQILDAKDMSIEQKIAEIEDYLEMNCVTEERMWSYFPPNGSLKEFATYLVLDNARDLTEDDYEDDAWVDQDDMDEAMGHGASSTSSANGFGRSRNGYGGGSSNLGGSDNTMYTYSIVPLSHNLEPKPVSDMGDSPIHIGEEIRGKQINNKGEHIFTGTIIGITKTPQSDAISYFTILDNLTKTKIKIDPNTATVVNPIEKANPGELQDEIGIGGMDMIKKESLQPIKAKRIRD